MEIESPPSQLKLLQKHSYVWSSLYKTFNLSLEELLKMESHLQRDFINFAFGSMFGAFIGDALGSYCQFTRQPFKFDDPILKLTMQMPGQGTFYTRPGQFTDDSEMAAHMLEGLRSFDPKVPLKDQQISLLLKIAQQYIHWYNSGPFDIGMTTRNAIMILRVNLEQINNNIRNGQNINKEEKLKYTLSKIETKNLQSCSNGSLMRITPMAFFIALLVESERKKTPNVSCGDFKDFIRGEINMTHGNPEVFESSYAWVELLVEIILRKNTKKSLGTIYENFIDKYIKNEFIGEWIEYSLGLQEMDATQMQGWVKIAFTDGIKALRMLASMSESDLCEENYVIIIKKVISKAGDTDTNAAIVGGLVGAVLGFDRLPKKYLFKQFNLELNQNDKDCSNRGSFYEPRRQFYKAMKLVEEFQRAKGE